MISLMKNGGDQVVTWPRMRLGKTASSANPTYRNDVVLHATLYDLDTCSTVIKNEDGTAALDNVAVTLVVGTTTADYEMKVTELFNPAVGQYWLWVTGSAPDGLDYSRKYKVKVIDCIG